MLNPGIIKRIGFSEKDAAIWYDIVFFSGGSNGSVRLHFSELQHHVTSGHFLLMNRNPSPEELSASENYAVFIDLGIKDEDIVADLMHFHPNGYGCLLESRGRRGVGKHMLDMAIKDSVDRGARLMATSVTTDSMRCFAEKEGFVHLGGFKYYRSL